MSANWALGALLSIFGSTSSNLGQNIQKYSFTRNDLKAVSLQKKPLHDPVWIFGLGLVIFGSLGDFAALSMVAQSIVAPLGSFTLVTNILFAHFWLKEKLGYQEIIGTVLIILGSTLSVIFGDHSDPSYTDQDLLDLIGGGLFIAYVVVICTSVIAGLIWHFKVTPIREELQVLLSREHRAHELELGHPVADAHEAMIGVIEANHHSPAPVKAASTQNGTASSPPSSSQSPHPSTSSAAATSAVASGGAYHIVTIAQASSPKPRSHQLNGEHEEESHPADTVLVVEMPWTAEDAQRLSDLSVKFQPYATVHPLLLCALGGVLGAQSVLFSKCFSVLLATSLQGNNQMLFFFPWVCFIAMFICIFSQLYFTAKALSFYGALYAIPTFQCFFIFTSAIGGACYFREVYNFNLIQIVMFPVGFVITLAGVAVLTFRGSQSAQADEIKKLALAAKAPERSHSTRQLLLQKQQSGEATVVSKGVTAIATPRVHSFKRMATERHIVIPPGARAPPTPLAAAAAATAASSHALYHPLAGDQPPPATAAAGAAAAQPSSPSPAPLLLALGGSGVAGMQAATSEQLLQLAAQALAAAKEKERESKESGGGGGSAGGSASAQVPIVEPIVLRSTGTIISSPPPDNSSHFSPPVTSPLLLPPPQPKDTLTGSGSVPVSPIGQINVASPRSSSSSSSSSTSNKPPSAASYPKGKQQQQPQSQQEQSEEYDPDVEKGQPAAHKDEERQPLSPISKNAKYQSTQSRSDEASTVRWHE